MNEEKIKDMINREYQFYFKRSERINIYKEDDVIIKRPVFNELNRRFKVKLSESNI